MSKNKVKVQIFGESYALKGDLETERVKNLALYLDEQMKMVARANPLLAPTKIAVLAALNITDEYLKLQEDYQQLLDMLKNE